MFAHFTLNAYQIIPFDYHRHLPHILKIYRKHLHKYHHLMALLA